MILKYVSHNVVKIVDTNKFTLIVDKNSDINTNIYLPEQVEIIHNKECNFKCSFCYYNDNKLSLDLFKYLDMIFNKSSYPGLIIRINLNSKDDDITELLKFFSDKNTVVVLQVTAKLFLNQKSTIDKYKDYIDVIDVTPTKNIEIQLINKDIPKYDYVSKIVVSLIDRVIKFKKIHDLPEGLYHYRPFINKFGQIETTTFDVSRVNKNNTQLVNADFGLKNGVKTAPNVLTNRRAINSLVLDFVDKRFYIPNLMSDNKTIFKNTTIDEMYYSLYSSLVNKFSHK